MASHWDSIRYFYYTAFPIFQIIPFKSVRLSHFVFHHGDYILQGWEFAHSLIAHSLIAHSLIRSNRSGQMSKCERFAQVAQDKRANERIAWFFWANRSFSLSLTKNERFAKKNGKILFFVSFLQFFKKAKASLIPSERSERIAQVAQKEWTFSINMPLFV